jgi:hypothetical protein
MRSVPVPERFVDSAYRELFDRFADPSAVRFWSGVYERRGPTATAAGMIGSSELRGMLVDETYQATVLRGPDPAGRRYWSRYLGRPGSSVETLRAHLWASGPVFWLMGESNRKLVETLLGERNVLWEAYLDQGGSRLTFTSAVIRTDEHLNRLLDDALGRFGGGFPGDIDRESALAQLRGDVDIRPLWTRLMGEGLWHGLATQAGGAEHGSWIRLLIKLLPSMLS